MNWIYEIAQFALLVIIMTVLYLTGIKWTEYPWHLAAICLCLVLYNIAAYKQGITRGADIAREACVEVVIELTNDTNKKL